MSLNKVMLIGNVGKDPEIRYLEGNSPNGQATKVARFPLATSERYRDRSGEQHENTEWHNIVAWRGLADTMERFVTKGTQLYIEGSLRTRKYTDQTGARYSTEIVADVIQLLGRRQDNPASQGGQPQGYGGGQPQGYGREQGYGGQPQGYQQGYRAPQEAPSPADIPAGFQPQQGAAPDYSAEPPSDDLPF